MPRQTFNMSDFSGGMNRNADPLDLIQKRQVILSVNGHFENYGKITYQDDTPSGTDLAIRNNSSDPTIVDLDIGLGNSDPSQSDALDMAIGAIGSPSDDLSWEDGDYNFRYTVCKDLGNGIIEEGPLQKFEGLADGQDMSADDKATFTFSATGTADPSYMDSDYVTALSICGRVYYSRVAGQGSVTQPGYIHLCDLIYTHASASDRIQPRAIGGIGDPNTAVINIEEPPTSASFEMNAGYPSEVGVHDAVADFGDDILAVVSLGMVKYIAATKDSKYYIYKSLPGQPDIWPTDNWVEMPEACVNMIGIGNYLCYWSTVSFIAFDVIQEAIVGHMSGLGLGTGSTLQSAAKCGESVVWAVGSSSAYTKVYSFNGQLTELGKGRVQGVVGEIIKFYDNSGWIYFTFPEETGTYDNVYSTRTDTWFILNYAVSRSRIFLPSVDFGEYGRFKKIYSFTISGGIGHIDDTNPIVNIILDENNTVITSSFTAGTFTGDTAGTGNITYTANQSVKVRSIQIRLDFQEAADGFDAAKAEIHGVSFVYRKVGT